MAGNTFGQLFKVTTFGESHGSIVGAVIDGCPAGLKIDNDFIQAQMSRRRPGQSRLTTTRQEDDQVQIVSGVFEGLTTGAPIVGLIHNTDQRSQDYSHIKDSYRPSHADYTYDVKYGHRDYRGGGRSSARETAARVFAGSVAQLLLKNYGIEVFSAVTQVSTIELPAREIDWSLEKINSSLVRCPHKPTEEKMIAAIDEARKNGDTLGGVVTGLVRGCPAGIGEPVFDKLHADLGKALLSINAVKGFEIGLGFSSTRLKGSEHNDPFIIQDGRVQTLTNHSGGIQGGISNGMDIYFRVAFKPVATIMQKQMTVNKSGESVEMSGRGRHDPCVLPRAVSIVDAMTALTLADHFLRAQVSRIDQIKKNKK